MKRFDLSLCLACLGSERSKAVFKKVVAFDKLLERIPFLFQIEAGWTSLRARPANGNYWWFPELWAGYRILRQHRTEQWRVWSVGFDFLGVHFGVGFAWRWMLEECGEFSEEHSVFCNDCEDHLGKHTNTEYKDASQTLIRW